MSDRRAFRTLVSPQTARAAIDDLPIDPGTESVSLENAAGRVLAQRIDATLDVPGFDRATMDGYAVRAADTIGATERDPVVLRLTGTVHAGEQPTTELEPDETIEISTGAVLPPGADAVVMVERTQQDGDAVSIETAIPPGENVMAAGDDVGAGERAIGPGRTVAARDIALLAAIGRETVTVRKAPRVGIISTGDELVRPGEDLDHDRGEIYDVNSHAIAAALSGAGGEPVLYRHVGDDYEAMESVLRTAAAECDLVLSSGSTSASAVDVIYRVVEDHGEVVHHGVAVKPGKPMLIGRMGKSRSAYIGLPGYPVSALMVFRHFVAPRLREAAGRPRGRTPSREAQLASTARFDEGRLRLLPVGLLTAGEESLLAYPVDKGSGATTSLAHADGVVEVPAHTSFVEAGELVSVELFDPNVTPPSLVGMGEDDPAFSRLLDELSDPRYLSVGSREGARRLERGIPDLAVIAGEDPEIGSVLGRWHRSWGLVVPSRTEVPADLGAVVDRELEFANLRGTALRSALDDRVAALADERGVEPETIRARIPGYGMGRPALESAARRVSSGAAEVGLALEATANRLDLEFVSLGTQSVQIVVAEERRGKDGLEELELVFDHSFERILDEFAGYQGETESDDTR